MKSLEVIVLAVLLPLVLAQEDQPRYACPEEYAVITGEIVSTVRGVASWEDCGRACNLSSDCLFWSWDTFRLNCDLKINDGDGAIGNAGYISGDKGCPPVK